jgi:transglutaminase-like putative cysteine protease
MSTASPTQWRITHQLCYEYDRPVFLEPIIVRLCPRNDQIQRLLAFDLDLGPTPAGVTRILDPHDNQATVIWFEDMHERFDLCSRATVRISSHQPFAYLLTDAAAERLPVAYDATLTGSLAVYRERCDNALAIDALVAEMRAESSDHTLEYLRLLVVNIPKRCGQVHREDGVPHPPSQTLESGEGSCRDLAVLFMELCRSVGLAARFVSGYCTLPSLHETTELHAWAEVYLPGAGWRGYDPTVGVATADQHIVVAAAADPINAAPTHGTYRGTAQSQFGYEIRIEPDSDDR